MNTFYTQMDSPFGQIQIVWTDNGVSEIDFEQNITDPKADWIFVEASESEAAQQLQQYFDGTREHFDLPLAAKGTSFQKQVWEALVNIPYGKTTSYGEIAKQLGRPKASRAVGAANGANPLAVLVPCHRVIGSNGTLTGYAGGVEIKAGLLELENALAD